MRGFMIAMVAVLTTAMMIDLMSAHTLKLAMENQKAQADLARRRIEQVDYERGVNDGLDMFVVVVNQARSISTNRTFATGMMYDEICHRLGVARRKH